MHVILTGATGTVGSAVLNHCLNSPKVSRLSVLSRGAVPAAEGHEKAKVIIHKDFKEYPPAVMDQLKGAQACIWAQGISSSLVNKDEYLTITYDYPMAGAKSFSTLSDKFNFVYVSGEGADSTEKTFTTFGKVKGRAEKHLLELPSSPTYNALRVFNVRPGFVDPIGSNGPVREIYQRWYVSMLMPALRTLAPGSGIQVGKLAECLVDIATGDGEPIPAGKGIEAGGRTVRNTAIRRIVGL